MDIESAFNATKSTNSMLTVEMKGFVLVFAFYLVLVPLVFADEPGVIYDSIFPFTVALDGDFSDWPSVSWHGVTHDMGWYPHPDNDNDASFEFACVADRENLYVAIKTWDDAKCVDEDVGFWVFWDDSMEIYIDGDNSKSNEYEPDVCQITIGRYNVGGDSDNPKLNNFIGLNEQGASADETGTRAAVVDTDYGWAIEAAIPLAFFGIPPENGTVIGFNIHFNDDDDWGERDHRLSWSKTELAGKEAAYINPSVFGDLRFVSISTSVSSKHKLITTWSSIKKQ